MLLNNAEVENRNTILKAIHDEDAEVKVVENAILRVDIQGKVKYLNEAAAKLLDNEFSTELLADSSILNIISTEELKLFWRKFKEVIAGQVSFYTFQNQQSKSVVFMQLCPVFNEVGRVDAVDILLSQNNLNSVSKAEDKLRKILENASIGILLTKPTGIVLDSNKAAQDMFGYSKAELLEVPREILFETRHPRIDNLLKDRSKNGFASGELKAYKKDGTEFLVEVYSTLFENDKKELLTSTVLIDITERKENELKLQKATQIFESLFNNYPDAVYSFDLDGKFVSVNQSGLDLIEANLEEILEHDYNKMLPEDELVKVWKHFNEALKGNVENYDVDFISYKGNRKRINITNFPVIFNDEITGVFGIAKDITVLEESKVKIAQSEKRFKNILDQSQDIICTVSKDGDFLEVSAASKDIWGYEPEELVGLNYSKVIYPRDIPKTQKAWYQSIHGVIITNFSNRYIHKEGKIVPVIWSVKWSAKDQIMYCVAKDATQIKAAEQKIIEDRNMLRAIIDNIPDYIFVINRNHETILTNTKFYSEYLGKYSEKETLKLQPKDYFPEEEAKEIMEDNQRVIDSGIPVINREDVINSRTGEKEVISLSKVPFRSKDKIIGLVGIGRNITDTYNFQQEQQLVQDLIEILNRSEDYKSGLIATIIKIKQYFKFESAEAWEVGFAKKNIRLISMSNADDLPGINVSSKVLEYGEGLPGITWKEEEVNVILNEENENSKQNLAVGVPVKVEGETIAVLSFYSSEKILWDDNLSDRISRIVYQISSSIHRKSTEGQLNNMFNYSPNLIAIIGTDGYLKEINPAFRKVFGFEREELLNTPFKKFLHPSEADDALLRLEKVANGKSSESFQNRCLAKDGTWKWISWTPSDIIEEKGILYLFGINITPIKSANLELLKYKNIVESSKIAVGLIDFYSEEVFINQALKSILGKNASKVTNLQAVKEMYGDPELVNEVFTQLNAGNYWNGDIQFLSGNNKKLFFHLNAGPVFNENKELVALFALHTDISERRQYEATLKKYNYQINNILESITDGFFSLDKDFKVTYWNREAEELLNLPKHIILDKNIKEFAARNESLKFFDKLEDVIKIGRKISYEEYLEVRDQWFEVNIYPSNEAFSVYFKDITDRKKVDEQIRIAKERYDLVSRATQEAVYDWDIESNILIWSDAYYSVFGYEKKSENESLLDWESRLFKEDKKRVLSALHKVLDSKESTWQIEYRLIDTKDTITYVLERGFIIRDKEKKPIRMIGSLQDVTKLKQNERDLEELNLKLSKRAYDLKISNQELEQFAYIASHDLQEPLRMVTSFLGQLKKKYDDQLDEKAQQYIYFANDGAVRMRQIILDLLEYSRVGRLSYQMEEIDLNILINEVVILHQNTIAEKKAIIKYDHLPTIKAAKTPLLSVLSNLISNGLKYQNGNSNPEILINVKDLGDKWEFIISDNGIGIDPQFFRKIFIIFQRLHSKESYSGTGIGLAISKKIIENHGGTIWLESALEKGSIFHFTIKKQF